MIKEICIFGFYLLLIIGATLISFGLVGVSVPIESKWALEFPLVALNIFGGIMVISLSTLGYYLVNKYGDEIN